MSGIVRVAVTIGGDVQGVGFRWFVVREAARLGLVGWVANAPDGTVRLEAQGEPDSVDGLVALVSHGPPGSRVSRVTVADRALLDGEAGFVVRGLSHPGD